MSKHDDDDNFFVSVQRKGQTIVTIGADFSVSRDLTPEEVRCIQKAAQRLLDFRPPVSVPSYKEPTAK